MNSPSSYGETLADVYDDLYSEAPSNAIDFICDLVGTQKKVLELGIGTGRFAIPLLARGVNIVGVDASPSMLEKLKQKPLGRDIVATIDDFASLETIGDAEFDLAFCNFSSFFLLPTQKLQLSCLTNTAKKLVSGGQLILETFLPDITRYHNDQPLFISEFRNSNEIMFEANQHDLLDQTISCRFIRVSESGIKIIPVELRYSMPAELDLMANIAGFTLENRWAGWDKSPFHTRSFKYISLFRKK